MSPRASVIIPNLNCPLVDRAVAAVQGQELPAGTLEIVVVGRDEPGLVPRRDGVRLLETPEPLRAGAARNVGVAAARTGRLLFTDADCRPHPDWARRLLAALERAPVAGGAVSFDLRAGHWAVADNIAAFHALLPDRPGSDDSPGPLGSLNLAATADAWERVGGFDEELATSEDFDWVLRARGAGLATAFEPAAVVRHAAVRRDRAALEEHAAWYGRNFHDFLRRHPGVLAGGPTWRSRRRLALARPIKALASAVGIFRRHPMLLPAWRAFPGVVRFKLAWYRAVLEEWPEP